MGKGWTEIRSLQRKHQPDKQDWRKLMQTSLEGIANKAKRDKRYRFRNLYRLLNEENFQDTWKYLNKKSALGVDKVSCQEYEKNLHENIRDLVLRLKRKGYRAKLVRRQYIPKANGKLRPLGIPATEDKLLQHTVMRILQAIYEEDFLPCSYGYRPGRGAKDAVKDLQHRLFKGSRYHYVVEADIQGFFDNMEHGWLLRMLEQRIDDKALLGLIRKWLKAGVLDTDGKVIQPERGTPQGGVISPILANIYMHYVLNLWFDRKVKDRCKGESLLCVYADDFVTAFQHKEDAEKFYRVLGLRLKKFGLSLSKEKTNLIRFSRFQQEDNGVFDFLGFEYRWVKSRKNKDWLKLSTSKKKFRSSIGNFKEWCKQNRNLKIADLMKGLNTKLRGYYNYFGVIGNFDRVSEFAYLGKKILFRWLNRRSDRKSYNWNGFHEMLRHFELVKPTAKPWD